MNHRNNSGRDGDSFVQPMPDEERLSTYLALVCLAHREALGISQAQVATLIGVDKAAVSRFERQANKDRGQGEPVTRWTREPEIWVAAYARLAGVSDSRDLWDAALGLWKTHGREPRLDEERLATPESRSERIQDIVERRLRV